MGRGPAGTCRAVTVAVLACMAVLVPAAAAGAAPVVHFRAIPLPIPGFPHTGYLRGAGAELETEYRISGTEYGGYPPPLIGVNFLLPPGAQVHPEAFPACRPELITEQREPKRCPPGSLAGTGHVTGEVAFGQELVQETSTVKAFYAPGGGLTFFTIGHSPVALEIPSTARFDSLTGTAARGPELFAAIPLVETVSGADDASVESIVIRVGGAVRKGARTYYYGTVPASCPRGGFTVRSELIFAGLGGLPQQTVPVQFTGPCPRR